MPLSLRQPLTHPDSVGFLPSESLEGGYSALCFVPREVAHMVCFSNTSVLSPLTVSSVVLLEFY